MMAASDVLQVLRALESAGIAAWVDGGWGIDALLGEQTRPHDDLDVVISTRHVDASLLALAGLGFVMMTDELPQGFVVRDPADRRVDFHPVRFQRDGNGAQPMLDGPDWVYPAQGFSGSGSIGGRTVRCLTPEVQVLAHVGYEPGEMDRRDLQLLHERFGLILPDPYDSNPP